MLRKPLGWNNRYRWSKDSPFSRGSWNEAVLLGFTRGALYHGLSLVDGTAFVKLGGISLAAYVGTEGTSTPYKLILRDSNGVITTGFIGAADAAEALGSELMTNPNSEAAVFTFDEDGNWQATSAQSNTKAHGGTYSTKMTLDNSGSYGYRYTKDTNLSKVTAGKLYKVSGWFYLPAGQVADETWVIAFSDAVIYVYISSTTVDAWVQLILYFTVTDRIQIYWYARDSSAVNNASYFYIDDTSIKEVTHVGATGAHIVSTKDGSTRNWTSVGSGFNYNDEKSSGGYKIELRRA